MKLAREMPRGRFPFGIAVALGILITQGLDCVPKTFGLPPPTDRLYFPTGLAFLAKPDSDGGTSNGVLYVASANWDKRYDWGSVSAIDLDQVQSADGGVLPLIGADAGQAGPIEWTSLNVDAGAGSFVEIQAFAGEMATFALPDGGLRLFVPSRGEGDALQVIDTQGSEMTCALPHKGFDQNCFDSAISLSDNASNPDLVGEPAAPGPFGIAISPGGDMFITHLQPADSPPGTGNNLQSYVVRMNAVNPSVDDKNDGVGFIPLGTIDNDADVPGIGVAIGSRYAYVSGLPVPFTTIEPDALLRLVDRNTQRAVLNPELRNVFNAFQARGPVLSADERTVYLVSQTPDALLVFHASGVDTDLPTFALERVIPLPPDPNEMKYIPRPGRGGLLAIVSTTAETVSLYDEDLGGLVGQVPGLGVSPFGIATDLRPGSARLFISDFGDGRVAIVDIPDLDFPQNATLVGHLGKAQTCIVQANDPSCVGITP